jgi:O-antigen ligase
VRPLAVSRLTVALVAAGALTALGDAAAVAWRSPTLGTLTIAWYGCALAALAWIDFPRALLATVVTVPLVTLEIGFGDVGKTLSGDKVALVALTTVWLIRFGRSRALPLVRLGPVRWWVALLVVAGLSAVRNGATWTQAWGVLELGVYALVFCAALDALDDSRRARAACTVFAAAAGAVGLLTVVEWVSFRLGRPIAFYFKHHTMADAWAPGGTIAHVNFLGAYLDLTLPVTAATALTLHGRARTLAWAALGVQGLALLYARSMGAWVGLAGALVVAAIVTARYTTARSLRASVVGACALVAITGAVVMTVKLRERTVPIRIRTATSRIGLAAVLERPLLGYGAQGYPAQSTRLERRLFGRDLTEWHRVAEPLSAHSAYVDVAVERGLPGLAAFVGLLASVIAAGVVAYRRRGDPVSRVLALGLITGLTGYAIDAFTDNMFSFSKVAAAFWIAAAVVVRLRSAATTEATG